MSYPAMSYDILNAHCIGARTLQDALAGLTSTERNGDFWGQTQPILNTYVYVSPNVGRSLVQWPIQVPIYCMGIFH